MLGRGWLITEALGEVRGHGDGDYGTSNPMSPCLQSPYVENRSFNHGSAEFE